MFSFLLSDYVTLYFTLYILSLFFNSTKKNSSFFILVSILTLIIISGLRPINVGADTRQYEIIFSNPDFYTSEIEPSYIYLISLTKFFGIDFKGFLFINSVIIFFGFGYFIFTESKNKTSSFLILFSMFFLPSMNLMRQWISMAIGIQVLKKTRHVYLDIFLVLLSSSFHITGLIFFLFLIVKYFSKSISLFSILFLSLFLFMTLNSQFVVFIVRFLPSGFLSYFTNPLFFGSGMITIKTILFLVLFLIFTYFSIIYYSTILKYIGSKFLLRGLVGASFLSFVLSFVGQNYYMLHRFGYIFNLAYILIIPAILNVFLKKENVVNLITFVLMFFMLIVNLLSDNNRVFDYNFLFISLLFNM